MHHSKFKALLIGIFSTLVVGSLSAQFVIPSGIDNALQIIQSIWVTTSGTSTGSTVMYINENGNNQIYINPTYLPMSNPYSGQYVLTLNASGYVTFTTGASNISGANISGNNLIFTLTDGSTLDL